MIKKVKIWVIALLCFSLVIISSIAVYAGIASYSAIVPRLGGNWYSASMPATGPNQSNYCSYTAAYDGNIWGNIVDSNSKEMANRQPIHEGYHTFIRNIKERS